VGDAVAELAPRLEHSVASFVRTHRVAGTAAGVVHGDDLVWSGGAGLADVERRTPADASSLYRIASITKTFTALAIMQLRDEGALRLDDPFVTHLPEFAASTNPFGSIEDVTIRRLLTHESGLMGDPDGADWGLRSYPTLEETLEHPNRVRVVIPPDSASKYSNLGFRLLGEIVSRRSGAAYEDRVREAILDPLGMASTTFAPSGPLSDRRATGYDGRIVSDELTPARGRDLASAGAEGGLWSCVEDLARWVSFQFKADARDRGGAQVLARPSLAEMHRMRIITDDRWTEAFGLGFYGVRRGDHVYIGHSGGFFGFTTDIRFHPGTRTGAIALVNGDADAEELSVELAGSAREASAASVAPVEAAPPMPPAYGPLVGRYVLDGMPDVYTVEWRDGALTLVDPSDKRDHPTLVPDRGGDVFRVRTGRDAGETAVFLRTSEGKVRALRVATTTYARLELIARDG
jgi:D-alanyl-D-alanine carboxypeptidase